MGLFSPQISTKTMVPLCRQLATAYDAGLPIIRSIETIGGQSKQGKVRSVFADIGRDLRTGTTLGDAVEKQERYLSPLFIYLMKSGEVGGHLDVMLQDLANYYEERLEMQRNFTSSMFLPIVELVAAWFLGTFAWGMLNRALGSMVTGEGGGTQGVMEGFNLYLQFQAKAMVIFALLFLVAVVLSRMGLLRWITSGVSTHIWPLSSMTKQFGLARFFRSFSMLLGSGLNVIRCVEYSAAATADPYMGRDFLKSIPEIRRGATLTEAFSDTSYMTQLSRDMLHVGETSGELEKQTKKVAEYHQQQGSVMMKRVTTIFSVMIILAVCMVVGGLIISFYSRLYGGIMNELGI